MKHQQYNIDYGGGETNRKNEDHQDHHGTQKQQPRRFSNSGNVKTLPGHTMIAAGDSTSRRHIPRSSTTNTKSTVDVIDEETPARVSSSNQHRVLVYDLKTGDRSVTKEGHARISATMQTTNNAPDNWRVVGEDRFHEDFLPSLAPEDELMLENSYHGGNNLGLLSDNHDDASLLSNDVSTTFVEEVYDGNHSRLLIKNLVGEMSQLREIVGRHDHRIVKVEGVLFSNISPQSNRNNGLQTEKDINMNFNQEYMGFPNAPPPTTKSNCASIFRSFKSEGQIGEDTFSLMMIKNAVSTSWILGIFAYCTQMSLGLLVLLDQVSQSDEGTPFNIPVRISNEVRVGQFFTIIIYLASQKDILASIQNINVLHYHSQWHKVISVDEDDRSIWLWMKRILLPNLLRLSQGILVTAISFVLIAQSSNLVDLLKDFSALMILSEIDNIFFNLARYGYLGEELAFETSLVQEGISLDRAASRGSTDFSKRRTTESFDIKRRSLGLSMGPRQQSVLVRVAKSLYSFRSMLFASLTITMVTLWFVAVSMKQSDGSYFRKKYNKCEIGFHLINIIGDGNCDGGYFNTPVCGLDGGDCVEHNLLYPNCNLPDISRIGDGICDDQFNTPECGNDQNDCCPYNQQDIRFGDGLCHGGYFSSGICGYDRSDCEDFRRKYPLCPLDEISDKVGADGTVPILGDGVCDSILYMTEECGYEGGDCSRCNVTDYGRLGNGICDGGEYNTENCLWDGFDCIHDTFPNCHVDVPSFIGDGICDGGEYMMSKSCEYDGLDCQQCNVTDGYLVGNGICNDDIDGYNVKDCSWDGQDCNYALGRHAVQSSTLEQLTTDGEPKNHVASISVDGNRHNGQLSKTQNESNPWWKVFLSGLYSIQAVAIYTEPESCQSQTSAIFQLEVLNAGVTVFSDTFSGTLLTGSRTIVEIPSGADAVGNQVLISITDRIETLCLSEVEVYGDINAANAETLGMNSDCGIYSSYHQDYRGDVNVTSSGLHCQRWDVQTPHQHHFTNDTYPFSDLSSNFCRNPSSVHNGAWCYTTDADIEWEYCNIPICSEFPSIAQSKVAWQSSSSTFSSSEEGVDGDLANYFTTNNEFSPWWRVHLTHQYAINSIVLHNMFDDDGNSFSGFQVDIFNLGDYSAPVFSHIDTHPTAAPGPIIIIDIPAEIVGNEVKISLPEKTEVLRLREVEVYGELVMLNTAVSKPIDRLKVFYYDYPVNLSMLPDNELLSFAPPYKADSSIGNIIKRDDGNNEIWTSGRFDNVAARFVGFVLFEMMGTYSLCVKSNGNSKLYLDDELIIDTQYFVSDVCYDFTIADIGIKKVVLEYVKNKGISVIEVKWTTPGTFQQVPLPFFHCSISDYPNVQPTSRPSMSDMPTIYPTASQHPSKSLMPSSEPSWNPSRNTSTFSQPSVFWSSTWRIITIAGDANTNQVWDVRTLQFFSNLECNGDELEGTPIASDFDGNESVRDPARPFNDKEVIMWSGHPDSNGDLWLGIEFDISTEVKCALFTDGNNDGNNASTEARLQQMFHDESWVDVMSFKQHVYPMPLESTSSSEQWRVFDNDYNVDDIWDVTRLEFYESNECTGPKLDGTAIASKIYTSAMYSTERAFDGNKETRWGGRQDTNGDIWLGLKFSTLKHVRCIFFSDRGNIANKVSVQVYEGAEWTDVHLIDNLPKKVLVMSTPSTDQLSFQNIARLPGATADQSSTAHEGLSKRAIDGNTSGAWDDNSITHTLDSTDPYWRVRWPAVYPISRIKIWNRTDVYENGRDMRVRLIGFILTIHSNDNIIWSSNTGTFAATSSTAEDSYEFDFPDFIFGDEVKVTIPGKNKVLHLAEVEVFEFGGQLNFIQNLALLPTTRADQSSIFDGGYPERAIDGNISGFWCDYSVTHTAFSTNPYWRVQWPTVHRISRIKVWNRRGAECDKEIGSNGHESCQKRLKGFILTIHSKGNTIWSSNTGTFAAISSTAEDSYEFNIPDFIYGDEVKVTIPGSEKVLHLAEVEVIGYATQS